MDVKITSYWLLVKKRIYLFANLTRTEVSLAELSFLSTDAISVFPLFLSQQPQLRFSSISAAGVIPDILHICSKSNKTFFSYRHCTQKVHPSGTLLSAPRRRFILQFFLTFFCTRTSLKSWIFALSIFFRPVVVVIVPVV